MEDPVFYRSGSFIGESMEPVVQQLMRDLDMAKHEFIATVGIHVDPVMRDASHFLCKGQFDPKDFKAISRVLRDAIELYRHFRKELLWSDNRNRNSGIYRSSIYVDQQNWDFCNVNNLFFASTQERRPSSTFQETNGSANYEEKRTSTQDRNFQRTSDAPKDKSQRNYDPLPSNMADAESVRHRKRSNVSLHVSFKNEGENMAMHRNETSIVAKSFEDETLSGIRRSEDSINGHFKRDDFQMASQEDKPIQAHGFNEAHKRTLDVLDALLLEKNDVIFRKKDISRLRVDNPSDISMEGTSAVTLTDKETSTHTVDSLSGLCFEKSVSVNPRDGGIFSLKLHNSSGASSLEGYPVIFRDHELSGLRVDNPSGVSFEERQQALLKESFHTNDHALIPTREMSDHSTQTREDDLVQSEIMFSASKKWREKITRL